MRSPSFLMIKRGGLRAAFYYNVPTLLLIQPTSESSKMTTDTIVARPPPPAVYGVGIVPRLSGPAPSGSPR